MQDAHHPNAPDAPKGLSKEGLPNINDNNRVKDNVVVNDQVEKIAKKLKPQIEQTVGSKITFKQVVELIQTAGVDAVTKQLENFPRFKKTQSIMNPVGFFIRSVIEDWSAPVSSTPNRTNSFGNFEHHEYTEEDLEALFEPIG